MALKVGVVGMRGIGQTHAQCHATDPLAQLVAVCDVVKARADEVAAKHKVKAYYSLKEMLANEDLDIVDVTTGGPENGGWHYEPAMEALEAGKHVLVEKPMTAQSAQAEDLVTLARKNHCVLQVGHVERFNPVF
jgi:predicted dehydrogenase